MTRPRAPKERRCTYKDTTYIATPNGTELYSVTVTRGKQITHIEMGKDAFDILEESCKRQNPKYKPKQLRTIVNG